MPGWFKGESRESGLATREDSPEILQSFREVVKEHIPAEYHTEVWDFLYRFESLMGMGVPLGLFCAAGKAGKMPEALKTMQRLYDEGWAYMPAGVRGVVNFHPRNKELIEEAYHELGIPSPARR